MEENQLESQELNNDLTPEDELVILTDAEVAELNAAFAEQKNSVSIDAGEELSRILTEEISKTENKELIFRHPQQVLTNKQIQFLFEKKGLIDQAKKEKEEKGEDPNTVEDLNETEKGAISLFLIRSQRQNSKPKLLSTKQRKALKKKRKMSRNSRKVNR